MKEKNQHRLTAGVLDGGFHAGGNDYFRGTAESADTTAVLEIKDVHLWHGRKEPYLYTAKVELVEGSKVIDNVQTRFGCRTFRIDPDNGFILNWFDVTAPEGRLSLNDKMGDVLSTIQARCWTSTPS